ncbi:hypothetical protein DXG03_001019 [Asterophora parasitica]|uniref:Calpain catalytic domain-containing protein n=1 Tax=Asterophora parasitica TaxID=117018 RepID=A0A9P7G5C1_9AGAR|nr:hypothetical protein DXG03_001019 [Asterophora parasitica]
MSTTKGLIEKFCVARDEQVGVYGFIFFRDTAWVVVIIDDLLFTSIPKFEELRASEKQLYHNDKETYNKSARRSGKSLYFAKSGTNGETWVPLIEKAYAKLHGNYDALDGGEAGEAIEDLTGGVTSFILTQDVLDPDQFWHDELLKAHEDRLFGCSYNTLNAARSGNPNSTVNGLIGGHAYSVLRAVEYNGKRFVVIRNPWGATEWTGPWSDGSKEWTPEWLPALQVLGHSFGDDGEFVMEYKDFLENWEQIDRTLLFDSSWVMSSQWLKVTSRPLPAAWGFGDVSFTISLPIASDAVIVLSKLDERYFGPISGRSKWSLDFVVFRQGEVKPVISSSPSLLSSRSVNAEVHLEAGEYIVHVRLDREIIRPEGYLEQGLDVWNDRSYARIQPERVKSQSIASNFDIITEAKYLSISLDTLAGQDLAELEAKVAASTKALKSETVPEGTPKVAVEGPPTAEGMAEAVDDEDEDEKDITHNGDTPKTSDDSSEHNADKEGDSDEEDDVDVVFLGLRVYTHRQSPAKVEGQLRHEIITSFSGLAIGSVGLQF